MKRKDLLNSKEYWLTKIQLDIAARLLVYMHYTNADIEELSILIGKSIKETGIILEGDFDGSISDMIDIYLAIGYYPKIQLKKK